MNRQHIRVNIVAFIRQYSLRKNISQIKPTKQFTTQRLNIDSIDPLPESRFGFMYILVVINGFTRFVELCPLVLTEGEEAVRYLAAHVRRYGTPS